VLTAVRSPKKGDYLIVNTRTGNLHVGNGELRLGGTVGKVADAGGTGLPAILRRWFI
jgi:hypothetical protein